MLFLNIKEKKISKNNYNNNNKSEFKRHYPMSEGNTCIAETKLEVMTL